MYTFFIPYPPSVNTYWGFKGHRRFLTNKAIAFKVEVDCCVRLNEVQLNDHRLHIEITLYPPDRRVRDIDNCIKSTLDALVQAGAFRDDSQVDVLIVNRAEVVKNGKAKIFIKVL